MVNEYAEYEVQRALHYVCSANNPKDALERFQERIELLGDWRVMYAAAESGGPFSLVREQFSKKGFVSTMLRGKSVWILDKAFVLSKTQVKYTLGGSLFWIRMRPAIFESCHMRSVFLLSSMQCVLICIGRFP